MAEYTIPKPYRDFYVTNPYIELKESNERLQKIVKSGYVATDAFSSCGNQVITFDKEKHGFSITNDLSTISSYVLDLSSSSLYEQGSLSTDTGESLNNTDNVIRTKNYHEVFPSMSYTLTITPNSEQTFDILIIRYNQNKEMIGYHDWLPNTIVRQFSDDTKYIRVAIRRTDLAVAGVSDMFSLITSIKGTISAPTSPSLTVSENVAGIPTTADGWEQGSLDVSTGDPSTSTVVIRTKNFIPVDNNQTYQFTSSFSTNQYYGAIYEYKENGDFIKSSDLNLFPHEIKTSNDTDKIKIILHRPKTITPSDVLSELNYLRLTKEKMIVQADDTRIVTMPPFTSLYIESNVPYHGHALDLAE